MGQTTSCCSERNGAATLSEWPNRAAQNRPDSAYLVRPNGITRDPADPTSIAPLRARTTVEVGQDLGTPHAFQASGSSPIGSMEPDAAHLYLLNTRKESWRFTPAKDLVGVGAYFECVQGGAIRVRGLAKTGSAASCNMICVGDELICVDNTQVHGRPLSELGQFILGPPGTTVQLTLRALSDKTRYDIFLTRAKAVSVPSRSGLGSAQSTGEVEKTLRV